MKIRSIASLALALLVVAAPPAFAQRGHHGGVSIGIGIGAGGFFDPYPYDPWPYYPSYGYGYAQPAPPPVPCTQAEINKVPEPKIDSPDYAYDRINAARCAAQAAALTQVPLPAVQPGAYYFCRSLNAYYPNVKECAEGWQQVAPKPPGT